MLLRRLICSAMLSSMITVHTIPAYAQVETIIATGFAAMKVSDIIEQFKRTASQLLDQANSTGNALLSRGANETNVLAQNIDFVLRDRINDTFEKLEEPQKKLIIEAEKIRIELAKIVPGVYDIKDTLALDLAALASSLPFVQRTFFVQSIQGLAYMPATGDLNIRVLASTLGQQEDVKTNISVQIKGKDVPLVRVNQSERRGQAIITIPSTVLSDFFKNEKLSIVDAVINFDVERDHPWWRGGSSKAAFPVPVYLALYPTSVASISVQAKQAVLAWKSLGDMSRAVDTPNRHCSSGCGGEPTRGPNRIEFTVAGGAPPPKQGFQRLRNPDLRCDGPACPWSAVRDVRLTDNDTRVYADFDTWGSPSHWTLTANVEQWDVDQVKDINRTAKSIGYDKLYREELPTDTTAAILTIKTYTGRQYELELGKPDPNGIVEYQSLSPLGNGSSVLLYRALPPARP